MGEVIDDIDKRFKGMSFENQINYKYMKNVYQLYSNLQESNFNIFDVHKFNYSDQNMIDENYF